jgi:hypothetical protein
MSIESLQQQGITLTNEIEQAMPELIENVKQLIATIADQAKENSIATKPELVM